MSYSFGMFFMECKPEEVLCKCLEITKKITDEPTKLLDANRLYLPSYKYQISSENEFLNAKGIFDQMWLYQLFNFRFVYWKDYQLLGLCGYDYNVKPDFKLHVEFQNSCDQNYEYSTWQGITCFETVISEVESMTLEQILNAYGDGYSIEEIETDLPYYKKSLIYKRIYDMLNLDSWLWGTEGNFQRITMNGIDTTEKFNSLSATLRQFSKKSIY